MRKLAGLLTVLLLLGGCDNVSRVDQIVLVNETDYSVLVYVKGSQDSGWLSLGTATRNAETAVQEVIDQGDDWIFRFSYLGEELGEERVSRSDLARNQWRFEIPERVGQTLKENGHEPTYR